MSYVVNLKNNTSHAPAQKPQALNEHAQQQSITQEQPDTKTNMPTEISWQTLEYQHVKKSPDWYWAVGILTTGLFAVSLIFHNILFGIFVLLAGFTIALYGARAPQTVSFKLSSDGVHIANRIYPHETLQSFWIFYRPPDVKEISIESQKMIMPHIKIPLGDISPSTARAYLLQFLPERAQEESLIDVAVRYIGF